MTADIYDATTARFVSTADTGDGLRESLLLALRSWPDFVELYLDLRFSQD